ncbi:MAG TPA: ABC transporter permease, partial [Thermoanaerobaculia bacterium]
MRHRMRIVAEVARWEFLRFVKPKQQLVGILLTIVIFGGAMWLARMVRAEDRVRNVAVIGADTFQLPAATADSSVRFIPHGAEDEPALREQVRERDLDGVLVVRDVDSAELYVRTGGNWTGDVQMFLSAARQRHMTERAGLSPEVLATILTPPRLEITHERGGESRAERYTLIGVIALMLMAVFTGVAYVFASITGEKQIRVTEQVMSAIPAQAWMDGKILGLIGVSIVGVAGQAVAFGVVLLGMRVWSGSGGVALPASLGDPVTVLLIVLFGLLGLCFWFAFLGVVAASIDDPNSSTRSSFLMLPVFVTSLAFFILGDGSTRFAQVLS